MVLETGPFDMRRMVEEVLDRVASVADRKDLVLALRYVSGTPTLVDGDPSALREIIEILVDHALDVTEQGHVLVTVRHRVGTDQPPHFVFAVEDTGPGVSAASRAILFDERWAGGSTGDPPSAGLARVRAQVEQMDGELELASEPGEGSTLSVTLPLTLAPAHITSTQPILQPELEDRRVLVVDGHPIDRLVLREILERWRFRVTECEAQDPALEVLREARVDGDPFAIALLGHRMPVGDPIDLCRRITAQGPEPVVLLLGPASARLGPKALDRCGSASYLTKPVHQIDLMTGIIDAWAETATVRPTPPTPTPTPGPEVYVLLVEDNIVNQKVAQHLLRELGCRVEVATNGQEAVERTAAIDYDLVLMDVQMPVMNGLDATRAIRQRDPTSPLPIVAMTAHAHARDRQECLDAGMDDHISKPVLQPDLQETIRRFVTHRHGNPDAGPSPAEQPVDASLPCDLRWLQNNYATDDHVLRSLIRMFLERATELVEQMREATNAGDLDALGRYAHALKGISGTVRATPLFLLMSEDPPTVARSMERIEQTLAALRSYLSYELDLDP